MLSFTGEVRFKIIAVTYTQQSSKTPVTLSWTPESDNLDFGADFTAPEFNCSVAEAQSSVVFESSNPGLLDYVDGEWIFNNNVSGTAFINASIPETDATYSATPATYTLTVNPKPILGAITINGKEVADEEVVNVDLNSDVVFAAENAEKLSYTISDNNDFKETDTQEAASLTWKASTAGEFVAETRAFLGEESKSVTFYLKITTPKQDVPTFAWSTESVTITEGDAFTAPTFTVEPADLAVAFTTDNESVAAVDAQGTITLAGATGTAVITATFNGNDDYNPATATTTITVKSTAIEPTGLWKCVTSLNAINDVTPYMLAGYKKSDESWHAMAGTFTKKNMPTATLSVYEDLLVSDENAKGEINILKSGEYYSFYMINAVIDDTTTGGYITCNSSKGKSNNNYSTVLAEKDTNGASDLKLTMDENNAVTAAFQASTEDTETTKSPILTFSFNDSNSIFSCYNGSQKAFYIYEPVTEAIEGVLTENGEPVSYDEAIHLRLNEPRTLYMTLAPKHSGYWKFVEGNGTQKVNALAAEHTPAEGYNQYVHENGITLTEAGTLYHYTHFNGKVTTEKALTVTGSTTGITEVEAEGCGEAEWFDLTGRRVAKPAKGGIFIIKQGSKTSKRAF